MIFVDTSAILARHLKKDQNHAAATAYWAKLAGASQNLITSNFVLDETASAMISTV